MTVTNPDAEVAWIDIEEVAPASLRADLVKLTGEVEDFAPGLDELCRRAHRVFTRADAAVTAAGDAVPGETYDVLAAMTGLTDLVTALVKLLDPIYAAYGDNRGVSVPEWAQEGQ